MNIEIERKSLVKKMKSRREFGKQKKGLIESKK